MEILIGGKWVSHPNGITDYKVNIKNTNDQITDGTQDFDYHSE